MNQNLAVPIGAALTVAISSPATAFPFPWSRPQPVPRHQQMRTYPNGSLPRPGYNANASIGYRGNPMTRAGFNYLNSLGGGLNDQGYYRQPINSRDAFGATLSDGTWQFPMGWEDSTRQRSILLDVQGGMILRQDYQLQR